MPSPSHDTRRLNGERKQECGERNSRRPRWPNERGRYRLDNAEYERRDDGPRYAAHAAEHADRKDSADVLTAEGRIHRLDDDEKPSGNRRGCDGYAKGQLSYCDSVNRHKAESELILRHRHDRASNEGMAKKNVQPRHQRHGSDKWDNHAQW